MLRQFSQKYFQSKSKMKNLGYLIVMVLTTYNCQDSREIEINKMTDAYVDILVVDEMHSKNIDSLKIHKQKVFEKYGITKIGFEKTLALYRTDGGKWDTFFEVAITRLDSLEARRKREVNPDKINEEVIEH